MIVFGDSHSTMWIPGLSDVAKQSHWQLTPMVKEACDYPDYIANPRYPQCSEWYHWAKQTMLALHPDVIVMSAYVLAGWEAGVRHVVDDLKQLATRVVLLSDAPGLNSNPTDCLLSSGATLRTCAWPQRAVRIDADKAAQQIAEQAGIDFIDVAPWFCAKRVCPSVIGSIVPYADFGHISATYARYLAPELRPRLRLDISRST